MSASVRVSQCVSLFLFCVLAAAVAHARALEAKLDEYMGALAKQGRFNGYVLVARGGKPVFNRGYGMANFENEAPNTAQTKFRLASVTKPFTAAAVLLLQERGALSLQDSVCRHLRECPPHWRPVMVEHLLAHTSGIPDYVSLPDFMGTLAVRSTPAEIIRRFAGRPLLSAPGEKFAYSNSNYYLLGQIIENVSGKSYARFVHENIFAPLGMNGSGYDDNSTIVMRRAAGYLKEGDALVNARYMDMSKAYAAGGLYSTAEDLLLWDTALHSGRLISKKSLESMFTAGKGGVGYGWFVGRDFGRRVAMQSGLNSGFTALLVSYPEEKVCIILLSNFEHAAPHLARAGRDLAAILFGETYELPRERAAVRVDPAGYDAYVGEYEFGPGRVITIMRKGDKLFAQRTNGPVDEILPESESAFFLGTADVSLTFVKDAAGKVSGMVLRVNGQEMRGRKVR